MLVFTVSALVAAAQSWSSPSLPRAMASLQDLASSGSGHIGDFFPESATGELRAAPGEALFVAGGLAFVGPTDGTMVPVDAHAFEAMSENLWDADKLAALVDAAQGSGRVQLHPGYVDLDLEDGQLVAQVRDGNHRTVAPLLAGASPSWALLSSRTRQDLDKSRGDRGLEALYRALRRAQREAGAPEFTRRRASRLRGTPREREALRRSEAKLIALRAREDALYQDLLRTWGPYEGHYSLEEQLQRPQLFWRLRLKELAGAHGDDWVWDTPLASSDALELEGVHRQLQDLSPAMYDLRRSMGLNPVTERLDPETGEVVLR